MCIMEVRPGQHASTVAQAMAHNLSTVDRDLDMFKALMTARNDRANLALVQQAQDLTHRAYAIMLEQFGMELAAVEGDPSGHLHLDAHDHAHGNERSFVEAADQAARQARRFETR